MKYRKFLWTVASVMLSFVLALGLLLAADYIAVTCGCRTPSKAFLCTLAILTALFYFCKVFTIKRKTIACLILTAMFAAVWAGSRGIWNSFQQEASFIKTDDGKAQLYADRSVMVIVPHEDDEAIFLSGVFEELRDYGSQVRVVLMTNGDGFGDPRIRMQESINYCASVGIPEENVIFLGYGDGISKNDGIHIYNAPAGMVLTSQYGVQQTYALETHPAYNPGASYTIENLLSDLESVILEFKPEWIFCIDYDSHIDHKALSLAFEKQMGNILKKHPDYRPVVFKGYAYNTSWYAEPDFYRTNILSTQNIFQEPYNQSPVAYRWEDRMRFPVDASILSRSLITSGAYKSLGIYHSQDTWILARGVVNGDRVFWQRRTDSLCLLSEIQTSSGENRFLNDFMPADNYNLNGSLRPFDGIWIPDQEDREKSVTVNLPEASDLHSIVLYDHPSAEDNVCNAVIAFDDGTEIETGPLHPEGAATQVPVNKTDVKSFCITLISTEGKNAGLGEIEAYAAPDTHRPVLVKLMDAQGNFAYDYCVDQETSEFLVYTYGEVPGITEENYTLHCDNDAVQVSLEDGKVLVQCPEGESGTIRLSCKNADISDSIYVRNPGKLQEIRTEIGQILEEFVVYRSGDTIVSRVIKKVRGY